MRIAYVAIHLEKKFVQGGVGRKIQTHMQLWQKQGHQVHLFLLSPHNDLPNCDNFQFSSKIKAPLFTLISRELSRSLSLGNLINAVAKYQPEVIYFRYGLYAYPLHRLFEL